MNDPVSLHPSQHLVLLLFLILAIQIDMWWYLIVVLISTSLMANNVEHFFHVLCHLYIHFGEMSVHFFCSFSSRIVGCVFVLFCFCFLMLCFGISLYILDTRPLSYMWFPSISLSLQLVFYPLRIFWKTKVLNFDEVQFIKFSFHV